MILFLFSFLAGSISVAAFAPLKLSVVAFICLAWLFYAVVQSSSKKHAFWHAFLFGMGLFGFGASWIYISLHSFGNMLPILAAFMVLLLVLLFSLISGMVGWLHFTFFRGCRVISYLLALPALWVLSEWVREWILTGFPWLLFGYSQTDNMLASQATISGVLGVSLLVAIVAGALNVLVMARGRTKMITAIGLASLVASHVFISQIPWSKPTGETKDIQVVQANIAIEDKWDSSKLHAIMADYFYLSLVSNNDDKTAKADITVWPEAAIPFALHNSSAIIDKANQEGINVLTGVVEVGATSNNYYNAIAYLPEVDLDNPQTYRKRHLVPFGEYIPFQSLLSPILSSLEIPMSNLSANLQSSPIHNINGVNVGLSICYEDAFSTEISDALKGDESSQAQVLINVSEDAWFGDSLAPHQRLQMAQMRALENARHFVRVSNNGLSAFINDKGGIDAIAPQFVKMSLTQTVPMMTGKTIFSQYGNRIIISLLLAMLALSILLGRHHLSKRDKRN